VTEKFSLKDHLFNENSIGDLAAEYSARVSGFDKNTFANEVMSGLASRELLARLEWIADCVEKRLSQDFLAMADQLESAMPPPLDPLLCDDDFGRFIHAVPGILAVRHGLESHFDRALDLLHAATQRFSMEFYIRPFLNHRPVETMARLSQWAEDENYHVRRLVSEGTRPKLPWAKKIDLDPLDPLPMLDALHADPTRYVTRSVANHLNDIAKIVPDAVIASLVKWRDSGLQAEKELDWMTRHALRTLIKQGHPGAMDLLGFSAECVQKVLLSIKPGPVRIGETLQFECTIVAHEPSNLLVDYVVHFHRPDGRTGRKVYKLKQGKTGAKNTLELSKIHPLKGNASTFTLHPGPHRIEIQVNGAIFAEADFELEK